jgi:hypothetical protein
MKMIDPNKPMTISLSAGYLSVVMQALYKLPYEHSAPIIDELRRQISQAAPEAFEIPAATPRVNGIDVRE